MTEITPALIARLLELCAKATKGDWRFEMYESGTVYVHMRHASSKDGPTVKNQDWSDADGHIGAHMFLYNVPAFEALTGETAEDLESERINNGRLIAESRNALEGLCREYMRLKRIEEAAIKWGTTVCDCKVSVERCVHRAEVERQLWCAITGVSMWPAPIVKEPK